MPTSDFDDRGIDLFAEDIEATLRQCEKRYRQERTPVYAWAAIWLVLQRKHPIEKWPPWLWQYFVSGAQAILQLTKRGPDFVPDIDPATGQLRWDPARGLTGLRRIVRTPPRAGGIAKAVAEALGFVRTGRKGAFNALTRPTQWQTEADVATDFYTLRRAGHREINVKRELAEKYHISESLVRKYWDAQKHRFPPLTNSVIKHRVSKKSPT
jgi:hypothetical protein